MQQAFLALALHSQTCKPKAKITAKPLNQSGLDSDQTNALNSDHVLYLQSVMRQRLMVIRKQAMTRWKNTAQHISETKYQSQVTQAK